MIAPPKYSGKKCGAKKSAASGRFKKTAGLFAVALLALIGILFVVWQENGEATDDSKRPAARKVGKAKEVNRPKVASRAQPVEKEAPEEPEIEVKRYGRSSNVPTSNTNNIHYASQSGLKIVDADGNERAVRSTPIFKSRTDNMLWAAIRPGGMPSGLNALRSRMRFQTGSDEAFLAALRNKDITIETDDPPHVVTAKTMTLEIKESIIKEMDGGRSFDDIYREISETTRKERMYERIAQEDMRKMIKAGDAEAVRKYVADMNPVMEQMGLKKLRVPSWAEEDQQ